MKNLLKITLLANALLAASVAHAAEMDDTTKLSPKDRKETIQGLLLYEYIAFVANNNCPGMKWNKPLILAVRKALGVTEEEKTTGELALSKTVEAINATLARDGTKKWCASAFDMLGRRGFLTKDGGGD
jgi:hypothetical protein